MERGVRLCSQEDLCDSLGAREISKVSLLFVLLSIHFILPLPSLRRSFYSLASVNS